MGKIANLINRETEKFYGIPLGCLLRDGYAFVDLIEKEIIELMGKFIPEETYGNIAFYRMGFNNCRKRTKQNLKNLEEK